MTVSAAMDTAVSASISTPVAPRQRAVATTRTPGRSSSHSKSTATWSSGSG